MASVIYDQQQHVVRLVLNAPPMNILSQDLMLALGQALVRCQESPEVRVVVLESAGTRAFSTGSDLVEIETRIAQGQDAVAAKFERDEAIFNTLASLNKPTLCAVEGLVLGGGLELAVCCDFIFAAHDARFALPEISLGAFPGSGGTVRVTNRIGLARSRRMMLLGESIDAPTAQTWGLVDEVAAAGTTASVAFNTALRLARGPQQAIAACRESLLAATQLSEREALDLARRHAIKLAFSHDLAEGLRAFRERRSPVF